MPGIIDTIRGKMQHATSGGGLLGGLGGGGLLGGASGGGGVLSVVVGPLQSRLATLQAAGTAQDKIKALSGTLGMRLAALKNLGAGSGGSGGGGTTPSAAAHMGYQVSGAGRVYGTPEPPAGIEYR
jgi:hypothetical protein